jgi:hypothetical protein
VCATVVLSRVLRHDRRLLAFLKARSIPFFKFTTSTTRA